jgi:uncharacterized protein (TIGR03032 family)
MTTTYSNKQETNETSFRSIYTNTLPTILKQLGISLFVTTYQAGKLVVIREDNNKINTHFRFFNEPRGLVVNAKRLAVGALHQVQEFRNMPKLTPKLPSPDKHDACYVPRSTHITNNIDIHEMALTNSGELWIVNTLFSCLCTLDTEHSFVPRWKPPFINELLPTESCHLNGLCLVNGQPKYVTALSETDKIDGWRENKADGGILMDVQSQEILLRGLSMPHSPRWYQNQLWLLESGNGSLTKVDLKNHQIETIIQLPGFTRGLDFYGNFAFIGLSQVREPANFSGIPLTERLKERICGVWVVDINSKQTVAFLRFEEGVEEIFAVQVLPGLCFPEVLEWDDKLIANAYMLP